MIEIYFNDLKEEAQKEVLKFYGYESAEEGNFDIQPLFILEDGESFDCDNCGKADCPNCNIYT